MQNTLELAGNRSTKSFSFSRIANLLSVSIISALILLLLILGIWKIFYFGAPQHYVYLADAFINGRLNLIDPPPIWADLVYAPDGRIYVPFGPLPAILLIPAVLIWGIAFNGAIMMFLLSAVNAVLIWNILVRVGITEPARRFALTALFLAGTVYISMPLSTGAWYQAQVLTVTLLFGAILETLGRKRAALIGILLGALLLTRITAVCALPFFLIMLYDGTLKQNLVRLIKIGAGLTAAFVLMLVYNYARFGTPFESGYMLAALGAPVLYDARAAGLFHPIHIPKNLYAMLLLAPQPYPSIEAPVLTFPYLAVSAWGLGLFWNTPAFIAAFWAQIRDRLVLACWSAVLSVAVPLCMYYGIGYTQTGYRYALDFLPFLFVIAAIALNRHWGGIARIVITLSILISLWAALSSPALGFLPNP